MHELPDILPLKVRAIPEFIRLFKPMAAQIAQGDLARVLADHSDDIITLTALGAGVERAWLEDQTPDVLIDLAVRVIEVNADFFTHQLQPAMQRAAASVATVTSGIGLSCN